MDELGHEIFKEEEKGVIKFFKKLPKKVRSIIFVLSYLSIFIGGIASRPLFDSLRVSISNNYFKQVGNSNLQIGKVEGANTTINVGTNTNNCPVKFCSDFKDNKWKYKERFVNVQEDPLILKSPNSSALPGATMFFDEAVGNFTMQAFVTPMASPSANLAIAYGHFLRCILGDGDYSKVSCQINTSYPNAIENWSYLDADGELHGRNLRYQISHFSKGSELQVRFGLLKVNDRTQVEIKLNDQAPLDWYFPKEFENRTQREKVGIGLFTAGEDDVKAVFKQFQLDPHI